MADRNDNGSKPATFVRKLVLQLSRPHKDILLQDAAALARLLLDGMPARVLLKEAGGAEALVKLMTLPDATLHMDGLVTPMCGDDMSVSLATAASIALARMESADRARFQAALLAAGIVQAAVDLMCMPAYMPSDPQACVEAKSKVGNGTSAGLLVLEALMPASAARFALVTASNAAKNLASALAACVHGGIANRATNLIASLLFSSEPSAACAAFACQLAHQLLTIIRKSRGADGGLVDTAALQCLAMLMASDTSGSGTCTSGSSNLQAAVAAEIVAASGLLVLSSALKLQQGPATAAAAADVLQALFRHAPTCKGDPLVARKTMPSLVQRLMLGTTASSDSGSTAAAGSAAAALAALLTKSGDDIPGFDADEAAEAVAKFGVIAAAATLCMKPATLREGAMVLTAVVGSNAAPCIPDQQLFAAEPATVPLLQALQHGTSAANEAAVQRRPSIRSVAANALGALAAAGLQRQLRDSEAAQLLLSVGMSSTSGSSDGDVATDREAGDVLAALHCHLSASCKDKELFVAAGGIPRLTRLLLSSCCGPLAAESSCNILHELTRGSDSSRRAVVSQGGLLACVRVLSGTGAQAGAEAAYNAMSAIRELCLKDAACRAAVKALGGIEAMASWTKRPGEDKANKRVRLVAQAVVDLIQSDGATDNFGSAVMEEFVGNEEGKIPRDAMQALLQLLRPQRTSPAGSDAK